MSRIKIAILGSCVTRDAFLLPRGKAYRIPAYVARTSFVSLTSPPVPLAEGTIQAPHRFDVNCIRHDFEKTAIDTILSSAPDYLILDFIDERFDLMKIQDSMITDSRYQKDFGVLNNNHFVVEGVVPRSDPATTELWKQSCTAIIETLLSRLKPEQIILHRCRLALEYQSAGERKTFSGYHAKLTETFNPIFQEYEAFFLSQLPGCRTIRVTDDLVVGDDDHRWKLQPFHYVPAYYEAFLDRLVAITGDGGVSGKLGRLAGELALRFSALGSTLGLTR
ncbi:DUF6270 domain-containing protein [Methylobacterium sp. sgz302541]|uniref:DUF6270 domain-containing protein n=1 Tax=unclassified Methylobacterium TaxID=2615210 RepID=UPI003D329F58